MRRLFWILVILMGLGALGWYIYTTTGQQAATQASNKSQGGGRHGGHAGASGPVPVTIATAEKGNVDITREGLGTVTPIANIVVRTQINGQLLQVAFREGQIVQKGDFLAEIDPRPYQLSLETARGAYTHDMALLKDAQLNLERYQKLLAEDSIAKQQVTTQQSLVTQYQGAVQQDQAQIDTAKLNLTYCHVTAPITGRVGLRQVDPGNYVQVSDANGLVTLTQLQPISVIFALPEDDLPAIMKRLAGGAELPVSATDRTQANKLGEGKLISVDNQIDVSTGTVKIRAQFDNSDNTLFPNQFVNAGLLVDTMHDVTIIPSAAIERGSPGTFVYLLGDDKKVSVRKVQLGPAQGATIAILDGLNPGDKVVVDGADKLRDGAEVRLSQDKTDGTGKSGKSGHNHSANQGDQSPEPAASEPPAQPSTNDNQPPQPMPPQTPAQPATPTPADKTQAQPSAQTPAPADAPAPADTSKGQQP